MTPAQMRARNIALARAKSTEIARRTAAKGGMTWGQDIPVEDKFGLTKGGDVVAGGDPRKGLTPAQREMIERNRARTDPGFGVEYEDDSNENPNTGVAKVAPAVITSDYDIETAGISLSETINVVDEMPENGTENFVDLYDAFISITQFIYDSVYDSIYENPNLLSGQILTLQEIEGISREIIRSAVLKAYYAYWMIPLEDEAEILQYVPAWLRAVQNREVALGTPAFSTELASDALDYSLETYDYWQATLALDGDAVTGGLNAVGVMITEAAAAGAAAIATARAAGQSVLSPKPPSRDKPPAKDKGMSTGAKVAIGGVVVGGIAGLIWFFTKKK